MEKVVFVLKPALLGAQCSFTRGWFYAQCSPLCPAWAFLRELAGDTTGLSCSRHTKVTFYVLRVRNWSYKGSFCLCCITCGHLLLHIFKQFSLVSAFLPAQHDLFGINRFALAPQAPGLGLAGSVLHWKRQLDHKPVKSVVKHAEVLHLTCCSCATLLHHLYLFN